MIKFNHIDDVKVYGGIVVKANKQHLHDCEIKQLIGHKVGAYGRHWVYDGNQGYEESNICVVYGPNTSDNVTFVGRTGLNECLAWLAQEFTTKH